MELDISYHFARFTLTLRNVKSTEITKALEKISGERIEIGNVYEDELERAECLYQTQYSQPEWNLGTLDPDSN